MEREGIQRGKEEGLHEHLSKESGVGREEARDKGRRRNEWDLPLTTRDVRK